MSIIFAYEGSSGSGKSTAIKHLQVLYSDLRVIERPTMPREQEPWFGAYASSYLEYQTIAYATMSGKDVTVDRFMLSRWVYQALQDNRGKLSKTWYQDLSRSWRNLKNIASMEAWDRLGKTIYAQPTAIVTVLFPPLQQLLLQRQQSGKQYPFDAEKELELYWEMTQRLRSDPILGLSVEIYRY